MMRKKTVRVGVITSGLLAGILAELVSQAGSFTVRLLSGRGAYSAGDIVTISAGEFSVKRAKHWLHCGNCPDGGEHQPQFHYGETVILQNDSERGKRVVVGAETFPHYFEVQSVEGKTYCETCFQRPCALDDTLQRLKEEGWRILEETLQQSTKAIKRPDDQEELLAEVIEEVIDRKGMAQFVTVPGVYEVLSWIWGTEVETKRQERAAEQQTIEET